jgi:hypothetical protein
MAIVPNHSLANLTINTCYGSLMILAPSIGEIPENEGVTTLYKVISSGDGNNTLVGLSETGLKLFAGGELLGEEVPIQGFTISGNDNKLSIRTESSTPVELLPGELVLVDKDLYFLDGTDTISSFNLENIAPGADITYDEVELTAEATLGAKNFIFQEKFIISDTEPDESLYPEGMIWLDSTSSPYLFSYLDKSGTPTWLPLLGDDVTAHAVIYGNGGHIPVGGITDTEVDSITVAKISDLDLSLYTESPLIDDIAGPSPASISKPWVREDLFWWYINSEYRMGTELEFHRVVVTPSIGDPILIGGFAPGYNYEIRKVSVLWDIDTPDGDTTLLNGSNKYVIDIERDSSYGTIDIDRDSDQAEVIIPSLGVEQPSVDFSYMVKATISEVGSPPVLNSIVVIISYQKILA